ncbi:DUF1640 domain-containing protein [Candidatus Woesearchaeota archaeon]|nr:DUF1640 domain-containing protein [Candidatus Woesearchaeota archaeon]
MANVHFDTHQFVTTLQNAGFEQKQAEGVATAFREAQEQADPVTRHDLKALELSLKTEIQALRSDMQVIRSDMQTLEYRMTLKLGAMMAASVTLVAAVIKLMEHT